MNLKSFEYLIKVNSTLLLRVHFSVKDVGLQHPGVIVDRPARFTRDQSCNLCGISWQAAQLNSSSKLCLQTRYLMAAMSSRSSPGDRCVTVNAAIPGSCEQESNRQMSAPV